MRLYFFSCVYYCIYYYWLFGLGLLSISWTYTFFSLKLGIVPVSARCISTSTGYHVYPDHIILLHDMVDAQNSSDEDDGESSNEEDDEDSPKVWAF